MNRCAQYHHSEGWEEINETMYGANPYLHMIYLKGALNHFHNSPNNQNLSFHKNLITLQNARQWSHDFHSTLLPDKWVSYK